MSESGILKATIRSAISGLRGIADSLESALNRLSHDSSVVPSAGSQSEPPEWDIVSEVPAARSASAPAVDLVSDSLFSSDPYSAVARSIPPIPQFAVDLCSRLGSSARARAVRAWEAGHWAKATLEGHIPKPRPTEKLRLQATVYIVVRAHGLEQPTVVHSGLDYFRVLGPSGLDDYSISHTFPSQAEGRVYCLALGIDFPASQ